MTDAPALLKAPLAALGLPHAEPDSLARLREQRLLLICENSRVGGIQRYTLDVAITARERGLALESACFVGPEGRTWLHQQFAREGLPLHDMTFELRRPWASAQAVAALARRLQADIVVAQGYRGDFALGLAKLSGRLPGCRCFAIQHGMPQHWLDRTGLWNGADLLTRRLWAERNISVASATARALRWCGWWGRRSVVVKNFVRDLPDEPPPPIQLPSDGPCFGYAGRLVRIKGVFDLLEAFALLHRTHPTARLVLAGGGVDEAALKARARELQINERLTWLGVLGDLRPFFAAVDFTVLPTTTVEGIPLVVLEAFHAGRAVVATPVGGVPEIIQPGRTGYLVPPRDPTRLAAQLAWCLDHQREVSQAGAAAREYAQREHSAAAFWPAFAHALTS